MRSRPGRRLALAFDQTCASDRARVLRWRALPACFHAAKIMSAASLFGAEVNMQASHVHVSASLFTRTISSASAGLAPVEVMRTCYHPVVAPPVTIQAALCHSVPQAMSPPIGWGGTYLPQSPIQSGGRAI